MLCCGCWPNGVVPKLVPNPPNAVLVLVLVCPNSDGAELVVVVPNPPNPPKAGALVAGAVVPKPPKAPVPPVAVAVPPPKPNAGVEVAAVFVPKLNADVLAAATGAVDAPNPPKPVLVVVLACPPNSDGAELVTVAVLPNAGVAVAPPKEKFPKAGLAGVLVEPRPPAAVGFPKLKDILGEVYGA